MVFFSFFFLSSPLFYVFSVCVVVKGSVEVVYMRSSAAYQAMKSYINVQLAEETVAHRQARALERVWICNQNTAEIFSD
ncbi:unnamed protein product, partial [Brassica rapa subsp. narinosa]